MELAFLVLILLVFTLPTFLMLRAQRKRQTQIEQLQASIQPGDRVVTVSGFHGTVEATAAETLDLEIAPGTVVTLERAGVMRRVEPEQVSVDTQLQQPE